MVWDDGVSTSTIRPRYLAAAINQLPEPFLPIREETKLETPNKSPTETDIAFLHSASPNALFGANKIIELWHLYSNKISHCIMIIAIRQSKTLADGKFEEN